MGIPQLLAFLSRSQNCLVSCGLKNSNKATLKYPNISHKKFSYEKYQKKKINGKRKKKMKIEMLLIEVNCVSSLDVIIKRWHNYEDTSWSFMTHRHHDHHMVWLQSSLNCGFYRQYFLRKNKKISSDFDGGLQNHSLKCDCFLLIIIPLRPFSCQRKLTRVQKEEITS